MTTMIEDDALWTLPPAKLRPPIEHLGASARLLGGLPRSPAPLRALKAMGQPYFMAPGPNGWPEADNAWAAPDPFKSRLDWAAECAARATADADPRAMLTRAFGEDMSAETRSTVIGGANTAQSIALLLMSPEFVRR
jgi:uncharacterized protein (DUF1800 family)